MNVDEIIVNDKMHSFCLPVESCVVCGDRASGKFICYNYTKLYLKFFNILVMLKVYYIHFS